MLPLNKASNKVTIRVELKGTDFQCDVGNGNLHDSSFYWRTKEHPMALALAKVHCFTAFVCEVLPQDEQLPLETPAPFKIHQRVVCFKAVKVWISSQIKKLPRRRQNYAWLSAVLSAALSRTGGEAVTAAPHGAQQLHSSLSHAGCGTFRTPRAACPGAPSLPRSPCALFPQPRAAPPRPAPAVSPRRAPPARGAVPGAPGGQQPGPAAAPPPPPSPGALARGSRHRPPPSGGRFLNFPAQPKSAALPMETGCRWLGDPRTAGPPPEPAATQNSPLPAASLQREPPAKTPSGCPGCHTLLPP